MNNIEVFTEPFEDPSTSQFSDATISATSASFDPESSAATGTAYFDNYAVWTDTPHPGALNLRPHSPGNHGSSHVPKPQVRGRALI